MTIMEAIEKNNKEEFFKILEQKNDGFGNKVIDEMRDGKNALHLSTHFGYLHFIVPLIEAGMDFNQPDIDGWTPIYIAADQGHAKIITTLKALGADVDKPNDDGTTPVYVAAENENVEAITALGLAGAKMDTLDNNGLTPLCLAVQNGYVEVVNALLEAGATVSSKTLQGARELAKKKEALEYQKIFELLDAHFKKYLNGHPKIRPPKNLGFTDKEEEITRDLLIELETFFLKDREEKNQIENYALYNKLLRKVSKDNTYLIYQPKRKRHVLYVNEELLSGELAAKELSNILKSLAVTPALPEPITPPMSRSEADNSLTPANNNAKTVLVPEDVPDLSNLGNAFIARSDKSYRYFEADVACVIRQYKKLAIFQNTEILDVISNFEQNTPAARLGQAAQSGQTIFGIFNIGNWHWTAFCILHNKSQTIMLYKDSTAGCPPEALLTSVKGIFGDTIQIKHHAGKEQNDGTSCGIFALQNLRIIASNLGGSHKNIFIEEFQTFEGFCDQGRANVLRQNEFAENRVLGEYEAIRDAELDEHVRHEIRQHHRPEAEQIAAILNKDKPANLNIKVLGGDQTLPTNEISIGVEIFLPPNYASEHDYQYRLRINNLNPNDIIGRLREALGLREGSYQLNQLEKPPSSYYLDIDANKVLYGLAKETPFARRVLPNNSVSLMLLYSNLGALNAAKQQEIQAILRKPGVQQPTINSQKPASDDADVLFHLPSPKPVVPTPIPPKVDAKDLSIFLQLVAEGEQDKAEAMLQNNKALALVPGDVTDLSKRTFTHITAFQYAVWALDWHMWTMIRKYLPDEAAREQAQNFETGAWMRGHGVHAQKLLDNLIKAYQTTIGFFEQSKWTEGDTAWVKQVGGAQLLLPAHVINEYCNPTRAFSVSPNFKEDIAIPRSRSIKGGEWFTTLHNGGKLGETFAIYRAAQGKPNLLGVCGHNSRPPEETDRMKYNRFDQKNIIELAKVRTAQRKELITELKLKQASFEETRVLHQIVQEQSIRIEQLEKALSREEKGRAELQKQLQFGKTIAMSQFKNFKNLNKHALRKEPLIKTIKGHTDSVFCLLQLPNDKLISGSKDNTIKVWDLKSGNLLKILQGTSPVRCLQLLPTGELISGSEDSTISIWDLKSGYCIQTLRGHTNVVYCLQLLSGKLVSGSYDNTIKVWNLENGECTETLLGHTDAIYCLQSLSRAELASGSHDNTIKVWDVKSGKCIKTFKEHIGYVHHLQQLASGELVSGSNDKTIKVWNVENGKCTQTLEGHRDVIYCLQLLPTGELISGSHDNTIKVWDVKSGKCIKALQGHNSAVRCLQLLPSGILTSGAIDGTINIWDLTEYALEEELEEQLSACAMQ